ncbi:MAG: 3-hydroxyacyl-CoA dehydrogenase NAD-binding domain-containing protein [Candidatus Bathyarchaeia archaeon]
MEIKRVACIGVGIIGHSWATLFAMKGLEVNLYDAQPLKAEEALQKIKANLDFLASKGYISRETALKAPENLKIFKSLEGAVQDADYIQESAYESYPVKKELFRKIGGAAPERSIIASSSSGLLMSAIQEAAKNPGRCITAHPWNPPHLIPLVELVPGNMTFEETIRETYSFMEKLGKIPVVLKKEVPGYIANRLQVAVWREALDLVDRGVASLEDVEKALYAGPGIRWAFMGPSLTLHLGGGEKGLEYLIEHLGEKYSEYWKDMARWVSIPDSTAEKAVKGIREIEPVKSKNFQELIRWRDEKLIALLKLLYPKAS